MSQIFNLKMDSGRVSWTLFYVRLVRLDFWKISVQCRCHEAPCLQEVLSLSQCCTHAFQSTSDVWRQQHMDLDLSGVQLVFRSNSVVRSLSFRVVNKLLGASQSFEYTERDWTNGQEL